MEKNGKKWKKMEKNGNLKERKKKKKKKRKEEKKKVVSFSV